MRKLFLLLPVLAAAAASSCHRPTSATRPVPRSDDTLYVYLAPLPAAAERVRFAIAGMSAIREDGTRAPLVLRDATIAAVDPARERLLAVGAPEPARYRGLEVAIRSARIAPPGPATELRVPEAPVRVDVPFALARGTAAVVRLEVADRDPVDADGGFVPRLHALVPPSPAGGLLAVVTDRGSNVVALLDKRTGAVHGMIPTGRGPCGVALDEARTRAYVAATDDDSVEVLDLLNRTRTDELRLAGGDRPREIVLTPDGGTLLTANSGSNSVSVIDPSGLIETARITVGEGPWSIALDRPGRRAYVFNRYSDSISVVDVATARVVLTLATDSGPLRGDFDRAGDRLFVLHAGSPYVSVIDPGGGAPPIRVYVGTGAEALKVDPRTDRIYVSRRGTRAIDVYEPMTLLPVDTFPTGGDVGYLGIDGEGDTLLATLPSLGQVRVLRLAGGTTVAASEVGDRPCRVAAMGGR